MRWYAGLGKWTLILSEAVVAVLVVLSIWSSVSACTAFVLKRDDSIILAKNLDWPVGEGFICVNRRSVDKSSFPAGSTKPLKWRSLYGSVTFNQFGKEFPLGGMNEKGLVIEELSYNLSDYPGSGNFFLNEFQWIQYHLDNSGSVSQVLESLDRIIVSPLLVRLHYFLCDRTGQAAIIEFISGEVRSYTGTDAAVEVLTNNSYENSLRYLRRHRGFGGDIAIPGGATSPERFVRTVALLRDEERSKSKAALSAAFFVLDSVRQDDTKWSIAYDIMGGGIHLRTGCSPAIHSLSVGDFDFEQEPMIRFITTDCGKKTSNRFKPFTDPENRRLLEFVFERSTEEGLLEKKVAEELLGRFLRYCGGSGDR
ncbi:MAG: linear amide C-N hydrolase [Candidatus Krumholzibacteriota bacterium]|nr:linear amide C-N hydrolase [Candidatus Krumholzibacteriota bacterium]